MLKQTNKSAFATEVLDLGIKINKGQFFLSIYDKTDDFQFKVRKFPDLDSNVHFSRTHDLVHEVLGRFRSARIKNSSLREPLRKLVN